MLITILFIGLFILLALLTFFRNVIITLLSGFFSLFHRGKGRRSDCSGTSGNSGRTQSGSTYNPGYNSQTSQGQSGGKKKGFDKSDAEYVDFEEVKH